LRRLGAFVAGGSLGLALSGLLEGAYIAAQAELPLREGLSLCAYGAGLHGLIGAGFGVLLALAVLILSKRSRSIFVTSEGLGEWRIVVACLLVGGGGLALIGGFRLSRDGGFGLGAALLISSLCGLLLALIVGLLLRRMTRRLPLGVLSILLSILLFQLGKSGLGVMPDQGQDAPGEASAARPNVILIVVDTLRADQTGPYGGRDAQGSLTPALDAFAKESLLFENFHSNASWTRPAVTSILTGQRPSRHGVTQKVDPLPAEGPHLADAFASAGYATSASVTNVNLAPDFGFERGFSAYRYHAPLRPFSATGAAVRLSVINIARLLSERVGGAMKASSYYAEASTITGDALELAAQMKDGPYFLWVHYMDPHDPYLKQPADGSGLARVRTPNPELSQAEEALALYQGEVRVWDQGFGQLIDGLRKLGHLEKSVVVLTADHGEEFGEHGGFWHGQTLFEELTHIPLLVRLPGAARGGERLASLGSQVDILPSLLSLAALELPAGVDGLALPLATPGKEPALGEGTAAAPATGRADQPKAPGSPSTETSPGGPSEMAAGSPPSDPLRLVFMDEDHDGAKLSGMMLRRLKLVRANLGNPRGLPEEAVYDLDADPKELAPLASDDPRIPGLRKHFEQGSLSAGAQPASKKVEVDQGLEEDLRSLGYVQ